MFMGLLPRKLEIVCIDPHQTGFVGKGSDHLQLIKFWPSCAPLAVWCSGNTLVSINAVALHRARLVLGWVTAFGQVNCLIT